jgi:hypothetical protein
LTTINEREKRIKEIEDRKIEILLKISGFKDDIEKLSALNHEYVQLGDEYYKLKLETIRSKQKA